MSRATFSSASGLRPLSAFVVVAGVFAAVFARVGALEVARAADQPTRRRTEVGPDPAYSIRDSTGHVLARFVPRFDLEMSPRSMWQAHTPEVMAREISALLGGSPGPAELLERFLPDARGGTIRVDALRLAPRQAQRLAQWIDRGPRDDGTPIRGLWLEEGASGGGRSWRIAWSPATLLSAEERAAHGYRTAWSWARAVAGGIDACLREPETRVTEGSEAEERRRQQLWALLFPTAYERPLRGLAAERVLALQTLLEREGVAPWQMRVAYERDRAYPCGPQELFGSWGFVRPEQTEAAPREGLELLCDRLLSQAPWCELVERSPARYEWLQDRTVRGERANGFRAYRAPSATLEVEATLDLGLQAFVHRALQALFEEHRPAVAMALVADVATGDVLAVDSVEAYPIAPFAPVYHVFTTGSTFKVLTMACALEEGVVRPTDTFDVGQGSYRVIGRDGRPTGRVIREAEHAPTGVLTAARCFAHSVNAGLTQIGLKMRQDAFRGYLVELGYGERPRAGLGPERAGTLVPLPWSYAYTQASMCFGHEISTTVWQHVAALSTVVRGGEYLPLRIVRAVSQANERWELPRAASRRVFSSSTCEQVRDLMRLGAAEGTGREVGASVLESARAAFGAGSPLAELDVGTKTGTAQKVPTEVCVHVEMAARTRWREQGVPVTRELLASLKGVPQPHPRCYTSSIVAFGSRPDGRELLVFVVAEEPRGKERFGSRVAGPTAAAILSEALGLTRSGDVPRREALAGFAPSSSALRNDSEQPWRVAEAAW
jgi:cell division protein FtsI/penicillin-binding protein 2